jgi:hypothetical protein
MTVLRLYLMLRLAGRFHRTDTRADISDRKIKNAKLLTLCFRNYCQLMRHAVKHEALQAGSNEKNTPLTILPHSSNIVM